MEPKWEEIHRSVTFIIGQLLWGRHLTHAEQTLLDTWYAEKRYYIDQAIEEIEARDLPPKQEEE